MSTRRVRLSVAMSLDGTLADLADPIDKSAAIKFIMREEEASKGYGEFATYEAFDKGVWQLRDDLLAVLRRYKASGKSVYAFGAPILGLMDLKDPQPVRIYQPATVIYHQSGTLVVMH